MSRKYYINGRNNFYINRSAVAYYVSMVIDVT